MKNFLEKSQNLIAGIISIGFFALTVWNIHDMQYAQGVGLYFAFNLGKERLLFDLAVDMAAAAALFLLLVLPCWLLKFRSGASLLRMELTFLSFMPVLSMAYLLHISNAQAVFSPEPLFSLLRTLVPFTCLAATAVSLKERCWKTWYSGCCFAAVVLLLAALLIPQLQQLLFFIITYLILLVCFSLWERMHLIYPALLPWSWILYGGLALRSFYVLTELFRNY